MNDPKSPANQSKATPAEFAGRDTADLTPALRHLLDGQALSAKQTTAAFEAMMTGRATEGEMGALLALLATRTPTAQEILGAATVMRDKVDRVTTTLDPTTVLDTAGTGGAPKTFNVSTLAAVVAAAAGVSVAKHGNRSRTGRGSAEVLARLGVDIDASVEQQAKALEQVGICFCFAPRHHPATRHVMPVRLALGFPTIFNLLGPLTNPAGAGRQIVGVYDGRFLRPMAEALLELGTTRAAVMHSADGYDEVSIGAPTKIMHVDAGGVREELFNPEDTGLELCEMSGLIASDLDEAAKLFCDILDGRDHGPRRSLTVVNAALALVVAQQANDLHEGIALAGKLIDDGAAKAKLADLVRLSSSTDS